MNCKEFEKLIDKYNNGELKASEEKQMEEHISSCEACEKKVDKILRETESGGNLVVEDSSLNEKKQRKILFKAKWKNRLSIIFFVLITYVLLQIIGGLLSSLYFTIGQDESKLGKLITTSSLITEFNMPNVFVEGTYPDALFFTRASSGGSRIEIKPYFRAISEYQLSKQIGKDKYPVGIQKNNMFFSGLNTNWEWDDGSYQHYLYFYHPRQLEDIKESFSFQNNEAWDVLDNLPEGTVSEMSVSFSETYTIDEIFEMFENYDLKLTWFAVETGQEWISNKRSDHQAPLASFSGAWGFTDLSRQMTKKYQTINLTDGRIREEYFIESLKFLKDNKDIADKIYRGPSEKLKLEKRYDHVINNGVNIYGVVVTGPTKELLKLKEWDNIEISAVGDVKLWNWFQRNFSGNMY